MNDLVQQLINPVIHKPVGRPVYLLDREYIPSKRIYVPEKKERAEYTRNPDKLARNKRWYEMHMEGFRIRQIAISVGANPKTVSSGVLAHKKTLEAANG